MVFVQIGGFPCEEGSRFILQFRCLACGIEFWSVKAAVRAHRSCTVTLYVDISGFYDSINVEALIRDGLKLGFPPDLLCLALKVYQGPRSIVGEELSSPTIWAGCGLIQGCPLAPAISKLAMFYPMLAVRESGLAQHEDLWIDDVTLDCQNKDPKVAATRVTSQQAKPAAR